MLSVRSALPANHLLFSCSPHVLLSVQAGLDDSATFLGQPAGPWGELIYDLEPGREQAAGAVTTRPVEHLPARGVAPEAGPSAATGLDGGQWGPSAVGLAAPTGFGGFSGQQQEQAVATVRPASAPVGGQPLSQGQQHAQGAVAAWLAGAVSGAAPAGGRVHADGAAGVGPTDGRLLGPGAAAPGLAAAAPGPLPLDFTTAGIVHYAAKLRNGSLTPAGRHLPAPGRYIGPADSSLVASGMPASSAAAHSAAGLKEDMGSSHWVLPAALAGSGAGGAGDAAGLYDGADTAGPATAGLTEAEGAGSSQRAAPASRAGLGSAAGAGQLGRAGFPAHASRVSLAELLTGSPGKEAPAPPAVLHSVSKEAHAAMASLTASLSHAMRGSAAQAITPADVRAAMAGGRWCYGCCSVWLTGCA